MPPRRFQDDDGDGFDDLTGATPGEYARAQSQATPSGPSGGAGGNAYYDEWASQQRPTYDPNDPDYERQRRDADSGRMGGLRSGNPNQASDSQLGVSGLSDFDESSAGTFLWGDISGATARAADYRRRREQAERQGWWGQAETYAPSADDLWVQYEEETLPDLPQRSEAGRAAGNDAYITDALRAMQNVYQSGGMTDADRAAAQLQRQQTGMATRAMRDADLAALEARGMGGSGAALASRLAAQQANAMGLSTADAQQRIAAQQRALQAMQGVGALGSQYYGQSYAQDAGRRDAIDNFNRWRTETQMGVNQRNTDRRNMTRQSRAQSRQQAYDNRERLAAGRTGQYPGTRDPSQVSDESNSRTGGFLGGLISTLAGS
ncbi:hypothetical protein [Sandaracinus amylolyticus]|uniref:hypothetical protein n=1 Tax=Sandaracinus amylolyticus TaxID=927083 RepID=UPI001F31FB0A|nr:hypothetical protein [Sandaracinus amylolyticus]UJR84274.1 Hypothetical protein I5071_63520 [Sandaracinus amylolyticus]